MPVGKRSPEQEDERPNARPLEVDKVRDRKSTQPQRTAKLIPPQLCFSFGRPLYLSTTTWFLRRMEGGSKLPGLQGIGNAGNTCYMNAAIQALAHCPPFMLYCLDCEMFIRNLSGQGVATVFCSLMKRLWSTEKFDDYINPRPLARVMQNPMFMGIQQQDSQEFLRCLLDIMHEELKVEISAPVLNGQAAPEADAEKGTKAAAAEESPALGNGEQGKEGLQQQQQPPQQQQQHDQGGHDYALRSRGECSANLPVGSSSKNRQPSAATKADRRSTGTTQGSSSQVDESVFMHDTPGARASRLQMFLLRTAIVSDAQTSQPRHQRLAVRHPFTAYELDLNDWSTHRVRPVHCQHGTCLLCSAKARHFRRSSPNLAISASDASRSAALAASDAGRAASAELAASGNQSGEPMDTDESVAAVAATGERRRSLARQGPVGSMDSSPKDSAAAAAALPATLATEQDEDAAVRNGDAAGEAEAEADEPTASGTDDGAAAEEQRMDCDAAENGHAAVAGEESAAAPVAEPVQAEQDRALAVPQKVSAGGTPQQRPATQASPSESNRIPPMLRAMIDEAVTDESSDEEDENSTGSHANSSSSTSKEPAKQYRSIVTDIFGGVTQSSVSCNSCSQASKQCEPFLDLSISLPDSEQVQALMRSRGEVTKNPGTELAVPQSSSKANDASKESAKETAQEAPKDPLQTLDKPSFASRLWTVVKTALSSRSLTLMDCLEIYFSPEELNGTNQYHCEECKTKVDGVRRVSVKKLPEIMCIHLKRFRHELQFSSKIKDPVTFPLQNLDMRRFLSEETEEGVSTYELIAVVSHIGGVSGGHYVTYVRHFLSSNWYELDDINVQQVTEQHVTTVEAYMLFYKKSCVELNVERAHVMRQVAAADCTPGQEMCFVSRQWVHRFNTCTNPGPITNKDFICPHGGAGIYTTQEILQMVTFAPRPLWESLVERYGGGPLATTLRVCSDCRRSYDALLRRRHLEYQKFILLNQPLQEDGQIIFLVDRNWFFQWRDCVRSDDPEIRAPGPMDNRQLLAQLRRYGRDLPKGLFPLELTWDAFFLLFSLYGGGPVIYAIG